MLTYQYETDNEEPTYVLRARDKQSVQALIALSLTVSPENRDEILKAVDKFKQFAEDYPNRMRDLS